MVGLWILVLIGCAMGALNFAQVYTTKEISAPQQAAGAAMAVAWAVIPYVFVRAIEKCVAPELSELRKLNETLATHTKLLAESANAAAESSEVEV